MIASLVLTTALAAPAAEPKPAIAPAAPAVLPAGPAVAPAAPPVGAVRPLPAVIDPVTNGGAAPRVLDLKPDADGKVRVTVMRREKQPVPVPNNPNGVRPKIVRMTVKEVRVELSEVQGLVVTTADGKAVDTADAIKKLADGGAVIATSDGRPVDPRFLKALRDDTLVLVSPEFAGGFAGGFGGNGGVIFTDPVPGPAPVPVKPDARPLPAPVPGVQLPEKQ